jgi:hypothetical protein
MKKLPFNPRVFLDAIPRLEQAEFACYAIHGGSSFEAHLNPACQAFCRLFGAPKTPGMDRLISFDHMLLQDPLKYHLTPGEARWWANRMRPYALLFAYHYFMDEKKRLRALAKRRKAKPSPRPARLPWMWAPSPWAATEGSPS